MCLNYLEHSSLIYTRLSNKTKKDDIRKNKQAAICRVCTKYSSQLLRCLEYDDKTANLYNKCPKTKNIK